MLQLQPSATPSRDSYDLRDGVGAPAEEEAVPEVGLPPCHALLAKLPFESLFPCLFRDEVRDAPTAALLATWSQHADSPRCSCSSPICRRAAGATGRRPRLA
eukprot:SAG11_NODE_19239_length_471_cov_0.833333_1_plen_101_part_10